MLPVTWRRTSVLLPPPAPFLRTLSDSSPCKGGGELAGSHENCDGTCQQCQKSVNPPYPFLFLPPGCRKDLGKPASGHWGPERRVSLNHFASRQLLVKSHPEGRKCRSSTSKGLARMLPSLLVAGPRLHPGPCSGFESLSCSQDQLSGHAELRGLRGTSAQSPHTPI